MKTIYTFIFCFTLTIQVFSQECDSLFSPCVSTFSRQGFYFDLEAVNDVTVSSFSFMAQNPGLRDVSIYYRQGTYFGYEGVASNWTLLGSHLSIFPATALSCPLPLNALNISFSVCIPQGQLYGFYMVMDTGTGTLESHSTLPEGSIGAQDAHLKLITGKGQFGIGAFAGTLLGGLTFQGGIQYDCGCVTSSGDETTANHISLFPNPVSNLFTIYPEDSGLFTILKVDIYDSFGKLVSGQKLKASSREQAAIDVSDLSAGIYFACIMHDDASVTRIKFVKE